MYVSQNYESRWTLQSYERRQSGPFLLRHRVVFDFAINQAHQAREWLGNVAFRHLLIDKLLSIERFIERFLSTFKGEHRWWINVAGYRVVASRSAAAFARRRCWLLLARRR